MAAAPIAELGFLEETEAWRLVSSQFPSKCGGRPAWLGEAGVPGPTEIQCGVCGKPLVFLLQVYAPCPGSFHRTIFIFCCRDAKCHGAGENRCFKVFRNQLPRRNDTYSYNPPPENAPPDGATCPSFQLKCGTRLCRVCGCLGPQKCSRCHNVNYCSKEHQLMDWKVQHKNVCSEHFDPSSIVLADHKILFPEYEIITEPEELESDSASLEEDNEAGGEKDISVLEETFNGATLNEKELEAMARHESKEDAVFNNFKKRIAAEPEQILRYCKGGDPLWISAQNVPKQNDIPNCLCGAKRIFEFQVMPQLLNHLQVDSLTESIDWGTLAIFTCSDNCNAEKQYLIEFLWKQDVVDSAT
ncbi:programmed cell death protein 2 [Spea bombifrons]|uniref:programmed cell death protein 2 n=1 Tax=Spea bombifrons TaxID=233779 RepID=UPI00234AF048|nr:programmed cell death protein 2 [Spea bombifrons]